MHDIDVTRALRFRGMERGLVGDGSEMSCYVHSSLLYNDG